MTPQQTRAWRAIHARLRRGLLVEVGVQQCRDHDVPVVAVVRHHLGRQTDPRFGVFEDVSGKYGLK